MALKEDWLAEGQASALGSALDAAQNLLNEDDSSRSVSNQLRELADSMEEEGSSRRGQNGRRYLALASTLQGIAESVR